MGKMISPFEGRLTQHHHRRGGYKHHKGLDIAPPRPGQTGRKVHAAFAGRVIKVYRTAKPGNKYSTLAPGRTGNGVIIENPDGEAQVYNHMKPHRTLEVGDTVAAGQLIGTNDRSGNQTGPHVHFECWADADNPDSDYPPEMCFEKFGVTIGSRPSKTSKPKRKPRKKRYTTVRRGSKGRTVGKVQRALKREGYIWQIIDNDFGAQTEANVGDFQRRTGLVVDYVAGPITQARLGL